MDKEYTHSDQSAKSFDGQSYSKENTSAHRTPAAGQNRTKGDTFRRYDLDELAYRIESHCRANGYKRDSKGNWNKSKYAKGEAKYSINPRMAGPDGNVWGGFHTWNGDESGSNVAFAQLVGIEIPYLDGPATPPDPEEKRRREEKAKRDRAERLKSEAEEERAKRTGYQQHIDRFNRAVVFDGTGSPYCDRKEGMRELFAGGFRNPDIRIERDGTLLVAGRNAAGEISLVQEIKPGWKHYPKDSKIKAVTLALREPVSGSAHVRIAEGLATAAEVLATLVEDGDETTGVFVAFFGHNLKHAAHAIHARYPDAKIIFDSDDDFQNPNGNVGLKNAKAAAKAVDGFYTVPDFEGVEGRTGDDTDFDDLRARAGRDRVRQSLARLIAPPVDEAASNRRHVISKISDEFSATAGAFGIPGSRRPFLFALNGSECDVDHECDKYGWHPVKMWRLGQRIAAKDQAEKSDFSDEGKDRYADRMARIARQEWVKFDAWQKENGLNLVEYVPGGRDREGNNYPSKFRNGFIAAMLETLETARQDKRYGKGKAGRLKALRAAADEVAKRRVRIAEIMTPDEPKPEKVQRPDFAAAARKAERAMLKAFSEGKVAATETQRREWAATQFASLSAFAEDRAEYRFDVDERGREIIVEAEIGRGIKETEQGDSTTKAALFQIEIIRQALDRLDSLRQVMPESDRVFIDAACESIFSPRRGTDSVPRESMEVVETPATYENGSGGVDADFTPETEIDAPRHPNAVALIEQLRARFETAGPDGRAIIQALVRRLDVCPSDAEALADAGRIVNGEPPEQFHQWGTPSEPVHMADLFEADCVPVENVAVDDIQPEPDSPPAERPVIRIASSVRRVAKMEAANA